MTGLSREDKQTETKKSSDFSAIVTAHTVKNTLFEQANQKEPAPGRRGKTGRRGKREHSYYSQPSQPGRPDSHVEK